MNLKHIGDRSRVNSCFHAQTLLIGHELTRVALALAISIYNTQNNTGYCEIFLSCVQPCSLYYKKITFINI